MEKIYKQNSFSKKRRRKHRFGRRKRACRHSCPYLAGTLASGKINQEYTIENINTNNEEIKKFLFSLGCYKGETITIISILSNQYIIVLKDARYSIDKCLASCICIDV